MTGKKSDDDMIDADAEEKAEKFEEKEQDELDDAPEDF